MTAETMVVGIDLGGTRLRAGAAPAGRGSAIADTVVRLADAPAPSTLGELAAALGDVTRRAADLGALAAIAFTVPGLVVGTTCTWVPNLAYLDGVDMRSFVADTVMALPTVVANDAHLALLGEACEGAAAGRRDALLLAIGTGIGSAVLADGRIQRGSRGAACSFGWACADIADDGDDQLGWLERRSAGPVLDAAGAAMTPPRDGAGVVRSAMAGDPVAGAAVDAAGTALGTALAGAVALVDPGLVIVSGGLADAVAALEPSLRRALDRHLPPHLRGVEVTAGRLGPAAGLVGALHAARRGERWWEVGDR